MATFRNVIMMFNYERSTNECIKCQIETLYKYTVPHKEDESVFSDIYHTLKSLCGRIAVFLNSKKHKPV